MLSEPLTLEDLEGAGARAPASVISRMRDSHHAAARLLALGKENVEVSIITGYAPAYLSALKKDESFKELLEFYRAQQEVVFVNMGERIAQLGNDTVQEIQSRLNETPESFTNNQLIELTKVTADRSGHGPTATHKHEVRHALSAETIAQIREAAKKPKVLSIENAQKSHRTPGDFIDVEAEALQEPASRDESTGEGL